VQAIRHGSSAKLGEGGGLGVEGPDDGGHWHDRGSRGSPFVKFVVAGSSRLVGGAARAAVDAKG